MGKALVALISFYAVLVGGMYIAQDWMLYPWRELKELPAGRTVVDVAWSGGTVPVLWMPAEGLAAVWFHGNGEQVAYTVPIGERLNKRDISMGAVEYPGYGYAEGEGTSEATLIAAARAGVDRVRALAGRDVACVGHSLGTGVAVAMAAEGRCTHLVLISPFTSVEDVAARRYPFLPVRLLLRDRWDSFARAPQIAVPTFITHGDQDIVVDVSFGRRLAAAIPQAVYVERAGKGHMDVLDAQTFDRIARFLAGG